MAFFLLVASSFVLCCCCCWSASSITPWPSDWVVMNNSSLPTSDGYFKTIHGPFRQVIDATGTPITSNSSASFELGFVDLASSGAFLLVIGMSMGMSSPGIEVWSANRGRPVRDNAQLRIGPAGNLLLQDADGSHVWDSGTGLVDSLEIDSAGDLSLFNSSSTVWRSFLHPTDSLLQGQIFSQGLKLVSNASLTNTSEGAYSLVMEPAGLVLYFNSTSSERLPYWSWTFPGYDYQSLDSPCLVKSSTQAVFVGFSIELSGELSPDSSDSCLPPNSTSVSFATTMATDEFYFVRLDMDGNLRNYKQTTTVPFNGTNMQWAVDFELFPLGTSSQCALPNVCGPYGVCNKGLCSCPGSGTPSDAFPQLNDLDSRAGCKPPRTLACDNKHHYLRLPGVDYFLNAFSAPEPNVSSVEQCSALCSSNCSCEAFFFHDHTHACFRTRSLQSLLTAPNSSFSAYLKLQNVTVPTSHGKSLSKGAIAGIVVGASLALILCSVLATTMVYRIARQGFLDPDEEEERRFLEALPGLPPRFSLRELRQATQDFKRKLGGGGFGSVYAGVLGDGSQVAVKRLDRATQGHKEFRAEVATIGSISHVNLVCLRGFCAEKGQRLLVYELMDNRSLDKWLYPPALGASAGAAAAEDGARFLTWEQRVSIAIGAAKGLVYLHEECREPIIHLDIKPQNILLDRNLEAKLADFGLARLMDRDVSEVVTAVRGTPGYLAPELAGMSIATSKCDVFSYGVVLLELVAGRRGLDRALVEVEPSRCHLPTWAKLMVLEGRTMEVVDPRLCINTQSSSPENQQAYASLIHLALLCVQQEPSLRPSMSTVLKMLQNQEPIPPITDQPHESKQGLDSSASSLVELGLMSQSSQSSTVPFPELLSGPR